MVNNTFFLEKMWILVVAGIISLYECNKYLIKLMVQRKLRFDMALLFLSSIFSHYYAWWAYLNYYNDDYYSQWNHQLFFTVRIHFGGMVEGLIGLILCFTISR